MLRAGEVSGRKRFIEVAAEATQFLASHTFEERMLHPIGCHGFMRRGDEPCRFDQQPIDAAGMVALYAAWYTHTRDARDLNRAAVCYAWFTGHNDLGLALFHPERGSCYDGLMARGRNLNQGAESTLAFWLARNLLDEALKLEATDEVSPGRYATPAESTLQRELDVAVEEHARPSRTEAA